MNRLLLGAALLLWTATAGAVTTCRINAASSMAFGLYDILSPMPTDSQATVNVVCLRIGGAAQTTVLLGLSAGAHGSSVNTRRMANSGTAGGHLSYGLFRDISRLSVWGNSGGVNTVGQIVTVPVIGFASTTFTIYGRIPAQQDVAVGSYGDAVQATLTP